MSVVCAGRIPIEETYRTKSIRAAIDRFTTLHGVPPETVNGRTLYRFCSNCDVPIFEGDQYANGISWMLCAACWDAGVRIQAE